MKHNVIYVGVYCQPINMDHIVLSKTEEICEQVIGYEEFKSDFNNNDNE